MLIPFWFQVLVPLLKGPLKMLDFLVTPRTFPQFSPDEPDVVLDALMNDAPPPLRHLLPAPLFTSLELIQNKYLGKVLDTLGSTTITPEYEAALPEYHTQVKLVFQKFVSAVAATYGDEMPADVNTVLSDLLNKLDWVFHSTAFEAETPAHWPLLTPRFMMHLHASLMQCRAAWGPVRYFPCLPL